jgi:hypothetical protein
VLSTLFLVALGDDKITADELFIKKTHKFPHHMLSKTQDASKER